MRKRMEMIFTKEELARITGIKHENIITLIVDVHGLKVKEAKRLLKNLMVLNLEGYDICVIHGFNHGTAIKEMISAALYHPRNVAKKTGSNPGRTLLKMEKAA